MARTNFVKAARKEQGSCVVCGKPINIGDSYKWVHPRYRQRVVACPNCMIPYSLISSSKMAAVWDAQNACSKSVSEADSLEDIASELECLAETAREVSEEYQEACDNQREYFPDSEVADENEEKAQNLEEWAATLESEAGSVRDLEEDESCSSLDDKLEEACGLAENAIDGCPD